MKRLTSITLIMATVILLAVLPAVSTAQVVPVGDRALLIGPVYTDGALAFRAGYAKKLWNNVWGAGFGQFGKSVEASGEIVALFKVTSRFTIGPVAVAGVDWSREPGTETISAENYFFYAAGGAATYSLGDLWGGSFGMWGYLKEQDSFNNSYQGGIAGGFGLSYRL